MIQQGQDKVIMAAVSATTPFPDIKYLKKNLCHLFNIFYLVFVESCIIDFLMLIMGRLNEVTVKTSNFSKLTVIL